ncbi:hypothetical protein [Halorarum halophilum]|nr:hypothetical protein [Halobaculum halophilum]
MSRESETAGADGPRLWRQGVGRRVVGRQVLGQQSTRTSGRGGGR